MFAYCNNNPVSSADPTGQWPGISNKFSPNAMTYMGGGVTPYRDEEAIIQNEIRIAEEKYGENGYEISVLMQLTQTGYASYYGVTIIQCDVMGGTGFSCGLILLGGDIHPDAEGVQLLKHEYGHYLHLEQVGLLEYSVTVMAPSFIGAALSHMNLLPCHYYSLPWEYTADLLGGVERSGYENWAEDVVQKYQKYGTSLP